MNPFSQNPIEFADKMGIRIAEKMIAAAYRKWRINPVTIRHWPRAAFVVATTGSALVGPGDITAMVILSATFALVGIARLTEDLPSIRDGWNARVYRSYSAKALKERESPLIRRALLCVAVPCITIGTSVVWSVTSTHSGLIAILFAFFLLMEVSILFGEWMAAAELPEPDDGDFFAAPQPT
jgi:hypothetical protein